MVHNASTNPKLSGKDKEILRGQSQELENLRKLLK